MSILISYKWCDVIFKYIKPGLTNGRDEGTGGMLYTKTSCATRTRGPAIKNRQKGREEG